MPKIVPTKNIDHFFVDIRRPRGSYRHRQPVINLSGLTPPVLIYRHRRLRFGFIVLASFFVFVLAGGGFLGIISFSELTANLKNAVDGIFSNFSFSIQSLRDFQPDRAVQRLEKNDALLAGLEESLNRYGGLDLMNAIGFLLSDFREAGNLFEQAKNFNKTAILASRLLDDLKLNGFNYFQSDGPALIKKLKDLKILIAEGLSQINIIQKSVVSLKNLAPAFASLNNLISQQYISHNSELNRWLNFFDNLISFFDRSQEVHFLLLFQNPSEIRPAGGFIGSYADVTIRNGQLYFIDVRDIYDPDGQLDLKVIPPEPIQVINYVWSARDANWFFDFPTSAAKVIYFLESSKIYKEQNIKFEAVAAVNLDVFKTILGIVGPIELTDGSLITEENVLLKLRSEIEEAKAANSPYPKQILKNLTPIVLERLKNLDKTGKEHLIDAFLNHLEKKDIMFFAEETGLQQFFISQNIGGAVYELPSNFFGSYLAVVNANIEGGKSDAFMDQIIETEITLDTNGGSFNNVIVKRSHRGNKEKELWWRQTNQNYIQLFTNPNSSPVLVKGNTKRPPKFREINYETAGYLTDPDVKKNESSNKIFGKKVFGYWFSIPAGQTKELEVRYWIPPPTATPATGQIYQFIYEKQSGVSTKLNLKVNAPFGYYWLESGVPVFVKNYESQDIPGRLILNLTLQKNGS